MFQVCAEVHALTVKVHVVLFPVVDNELQSPPVPLTGPDFTVSAVTRVLAPDGSRDNWLLEAAPKGGIWGRSERDGIGQYRAHRGRLYLEQNVGLQLAKLVFDLQLVLEL